MDKNTIIGIVCILAIFIGFSLYNRPSEEQLAQEQRYRDSIAEVQARQYDAEVEQTKLRDSIAKAASVENIEASDSATKAQYAAQLGKFASNAFGENQDIVLQNKNMKVKISSHGAKVSEVELLGYKTYSGDTLFVMKDDPENVLNLDFFSGSNAISTKNLFFQYQGAQELTAAEGNPAKAVFRAMVDENSWLEFSYSLAEDSYLLNYDINFHNLSNVLNKNTSYIDFTWSQFLPVLERGNKWEMQHSGLYYKFDDEATDNLSLTAENDEKDLTGDSRWIAYKGEFFSSALIAKTSFNNAKVSFQNTNLNHNFKFMTTEVSFSTSDTTKQMAFFFGPNQYKVLKDIRLDGQTDDDPELELEGLVPLGWSLCRWINKIAIIPLFNWLGSFISSYGLIILIMTLIIKLVLFPLTYKSYKSSAAMRVLKPQMEAINKKYPKQEQAMQKQQEMMKLYKKAGVSPMGGCLPLLLQMPILIAMFYFFPASIELRQQPFLWATDLSSYDSILDLPFSIPWYGDHVSLFTLLMSIAIIVSTKINTAQMDSSQSMPGMKMMMYLMPIMMMFWFNDYSSGLSYYYLLSNIITIIQMYVVRKTINEKEILDRLNSKAPANSGKKKSGFMARLEEMQRKQMEMYKEQQKKNNRR